jgi:ATP-dependent helicase/nuclease subunit A
VPGTGRPTATARAWRERLAHVFVDEYQDINEAQDAILTALSRDGAPAGETPNTGNRFMVGDVKQSIYRFRLANPRIFGRYAKRWAAPGGDGRRILLAENFRSREVLLSFINPLFAALMREEAGGVDYEALVFGAPQKTRRAGCQTRRRAVRGVSSHCAGRRRRQRR